MKKVERIFVQNSNLQIGIFSVDLLPENNIDSDAKIIDTSVMRCEYTWV